MIYQARCGGTKVAGKNWVYENGAPSKRPGWKQVAYVADANIGVDEAINLVYAGKKFYTVELTETGVGYMTTEIEGFTGTYDRKVQFFKQGRPSFYRRHRLVSCLA